MAEPTQFQFDLVEVGAMLLRKQGLKEGLWAVGVNFSLAAMEAGPSEDKKVPAVLVAVDKIQVTKVDQRGPLVIDASSLK